MKNHTKPCKQIYVMIQFIPPSHIIMPGYQYLKRKDGHYFYPTLSSQVQRNWHLRISVGMSAVTLVIQYYSCFMNLWAASVQSLEAQSENIKQSSLCRRNIWALTCILIHERLHNFQTGRYASRYSPCDVYTNKSRHVNLTAQMVCIKIYSPHSLMLLTIVALLLHPAELRVLC